VNSTSRPRAPLALTASDSAASAAGWHSGWHAPVTATVPAQPPPVCQGRRPGEPGPDGPLASVCRGHQPEAGRRRRPRAKGGPQWPTAATLSGLSGIRSCEMSIQTIAVLELKAGVRGTE
jgi:hypothetical protein